MSTLQPAAGHGLQEKLLIQGEKSLSDAELLALFIDSNLELAFELVSQLGDMRTILNANQTSFPQMKGLYVQLKAAREICRRSDFISLQKKNQLTTTEHTYRFLKQQLRDKKNETFAGLFLDNQHRVLAYEELFSGTINSATIHSRPIVERVLQLNAAAVILAHNHPSGIVDASPQDLAVTKRLRYALDLVDARLLDHLIIGDNEIYSMMNKLKWPCY